MQLRLFSHDGNLRILKFNCKCAFTIKFQNTQKTPCVRQNTSRDVFWNAHLKWRCRGVLQIRFSQITQRSLCVNDLTSESCFVGAKWAELAWPSNHFRRRTVLHTCRGNVNNTRACFDWQATQTLLFALSRITFLDLSCVRCVIQNTEVLRSCVRCVFQNAHLQLNFKIRKLPSCENGLSKTKAWSL